MAAEETAMPLTATPLLDLYESQARAAARVVESWRAAPPDAAHYARDVDDLIAELAAEFPRHVERMYHREWRRAADGPLRDCVPIGEAVFGIWDAYTEVLRGVRDLARSLAAQGHAVPHVPDLDAAIARLERHRAQAYAGWPWFRPEDEAEALAQVARGEYVTNEDLLREVQDRLARKHAG
jgi:hypothetical protein